MDQNERRVIDDLFAKLREAETQAEARDADAEALIRRHVEGQPASPYYMAQAIVVQQDALEKAQTRIRHLERQLAERPAGGGFLSSLFGGGQEAETPHPSPRSRAGEPDLGRYRQEGGGGFLGGAVQTAMGVAGGFLIVDALSSLLAPDEAAAESATTETADFGAEQDRLASGDAFGSDADLGGDTGGDF